MMTPPQKGNKNSLLFNTEKRLPTSYLRSRLLCIVILQPLSCETNPKFIIYQKRNKKKQLAVILFFFNIVRCCDMGYTQVLFVWSGDLCIQLNDIRITRFYFVLFITCSWPNHFVEVATNNWNLLSNSGSVNRSVQLNEWWKSLLPHVLHWTILKKIMGTTTVGWNSSEIVVFLRWPTDPMHELLTKVEN